MMATQHDNHAPDTLRIAIPSTGDRPSTSLRTMRLNDDALPHGQVIENAPIAHYI
jgi:hypothetical protein